MRGSEAVINNADAPSRRIADAAHLAPKSRESQIVCVLARSIARSRNVTSVKFSVVITVRILLWANLLHISGSDVLRIRIIDAFVKYLTL